MEENKEETDRKYTWLVYNISPWEEVVNCWKNTTKRRFLENKQKSIDEIYKKWRALENSSGLDLVSQLLYKP